MQKRRDIKNFYIDEEFFPIWQEFKRICQREDESISHKLRKFIARYVAIHRKGNPQLRLEPFIGEASQVCFRCEGHFPVLHRVKFISGLVKDVCSECLKEYRERNLIRKVLTGRV